MAAMSLSERAKAFQPTARAGWAGRRKWTFSTKRSLVTTQSHPGLPRSTAASSPMPTRTPPPVGKRRCKKRTKSVSLRIREDSTPKDKKPYKDLVFP